MCLVRRKCENSIANVDIANGVADVFHHAHPSITVAEWVLGCLALKGAQIGIEQSTDPQNGTWLLEWRILGYFHSQKGFA